MALAPQTRYRMYVDDTGSIGRLIEGNAQTRFAGITGVIMQLDYARKTFDPGFRELRDRHFDKDPNTGKAPVLHLRKMKKAMGCFEWLLDSDRRAAWERGCFSMYQRAQFEVITILVDKVEFMKQHPRWDGSWYGLLVRNAIERYFYYLRYKGRGDIVVEAVGAELDQIIKATHRNCYAQGTEYISADKISSVLTSREIKIKPKTDDIPGLQLADLLASTCFSHCRRIYAAGPSYNGFAMQVADLLEREKFYRSNAGDPHGYGRVWRP